jgi:thermostable 8-oxoguanine DNA glycosylase
MDIKLIINKEDIDKIAEMIRKQENNDIFVERVNKNIKNRSLHLSKDDIWRTIVGCLLSTQQNVQQGKPVVKFFELDPFPLCLEKCNKNDLRSYTEKVLLNFGGIRRYEVIGKELEENLKWLDNSKGKGWDQIFYEAEKLAKIRERDPVFEDIEKERRASNLVANLKGFGPKQSRNFWQWMGYTRYEIPLDSRVTKWINISGILPIKLSSKALSDKDYYEMVLDWIQYLCKEVNVLPCLLDAAIFSSYE